MKRYYSLLMIVLFFTFSIILIYSFLVNTDSLVENKDKIDETVIIRSNDVDTLYGIEIKDPYRWLEDYDSYETEEWVKYQNNKTYNYLNNIPYREKMKERMTAIWEFPKESEPIKRGNKYFYYKNNGLENHSVLYYKNDIDGEEIELLNPNLFSKDGDIYLSTFSISDNGKYLGYTTSKAGSDWQDIYIKNIETLQNLDEVLKWVKFSEIAWYGDGFFYTGFYGYNENTNSIEKNEICKILYHEIGTSQDNDAIVFYDKKNPHYSYYADVVNSKRYLIMTASYSTGGNSIYIKDLRTLDSPVVKITENFDCFKYVIDEIDGYIYILTNYNASNFKVVKVDLNNPYKENWEDFIKEDEGVIQSVYYLGNRFIINYKKDAYSVVKIFDKNGKYLHNIDMDHIGIIRGFNSERQDTITYYSVTSYTTPSTIYKYNITENQSTLYYVPKTIINTDDYETKQVFYESKDGTKVPMFIVHKKGIKLNGKNPTMLHAYGGFGFPIIPNFDVSRFLFLEQGGIFASAGIRGGNEYGEEWHYAGALMNKQNAFDDFIAAAEFLINEKYTSSNKLAIFGASAGGLTIAAVTNQRPDLFAVALPTMGILDMLRYQHFTIGKYWAGEFGIVDDSEEVFRNLYGYSPLHNIKENVEYPAILITTSEYDERIYPAHSFKYAATLQEKYNGKNPILIRIESQSGFYGVGKSTEKIIDEYTDMYVFTFYNLGVKPKY